MLVINDGHDGHLPARGHWVRITIQRRHCSKHESRIAGGWVTPTQTNLTSEVSLSTHDWGIFISTPIHIPVQLKDVYTVMKEDLVCANERPYQTPKR